MKTVNLKFAPRIQKSNSFCQQSSYPLPVKMIKGQGEIKLVLQLQELENNHYYPQKTKTEISRTHLSKNSLST